MTPQILIGADPELFVRNKRTGEFVSAHNLLPGTKDAPHKVTAGAVQVDGVAAEFNILPAKNTTEFVSNIENVMGSLRGFVGDDYELVSEPAVTFPEEYFKSLPDYTRELGCNPDFNAWTGEINTKPDGDSTTMRTAAGHVHIGWDKNIDVTNDTHFNDCRIIAKNLDYYLGLFSLMWDSDSQRRKLYGKAGSFRPKPYGLEYRPLSNVWLRTQKLQAWVYSSALACVTSLIESAGDNRMDLKFGDLAREFIDNSESWWRPEDAGKSKDHKKLQGLIRATGLSLPPPLPLPKDVKEAVKPSPKHVYKKSTLKAALNLETLLGNTPNFGTLTDDF